MQTNLNDKETLIKFLAGIESREDWLTVVRFGLPTLLEDQLFLIELIVERAEKEADNHSIIGYISGIFEDLKLELAAASGENQC